jgi:penicillin G amidase
MQPSKTLIVMTDGTLLGGRDGWIGSSTFMDQRALWQRHEYERIPLRAETGRQLFRHETILTP